ncbi:BMP family ABC transporter substrate-binding protein [Streptomyces sp. B-S-A6]|uniref:BMP family ABC transporter substrate-binding protein n=2 Tax=Streptomyces cavernicola TaxID=3043613 RepID=A0ABT6SM89_9ACTN|nr:BMP family ABC transporter substrate-binding protein [Streptomyces sp. B-S-A6]MDI3409302.1 BMP family ABC transporter substrate-binding protein [Streptomyces sp. B-S-A6]
MPRTTRTRITRRCAHAAAAVAALALVVTGCGETSSGGSGEKGDKGMAIAFDIGGKGDQSFNDAAYAGLERARKEFGYQGNAVEPKDGESDADKVQRLKQLAKQGYDPVVGIGFIYANATKEAAEAYPDTTFGIVDDSTVKAKNVAPLVFNEEQGSYLAGVAAAKASKSKTVGFVGGVDVPLIHKFEAGFAQGVKDTDPKIKVITQYLTETAEEGGFSSPDKGKAAAEAQIEKGADVIYQAAGLSGQGVVEAAAKEKKWAIGVDSDQYKQKALSKYKDYILTSATKDVGGAVFALAESVERGKPLSGEQRFSLKEGGVGVTESNPEFGKVPGLKAAVDRAKKDIVDGKIEVATAP